MRLAALLTALALCGGAACAQTSASPPSSQPGPGAPAVTAADAFLAANARQPGVRVLPSGLQYKVVTAGTGPSPKPGDAIKVDYEGRLTSGEVFDSSFQRGKPALMILEHLVPGWMEAIPLMRVGDEWTLYVPPALGYGDQGAGPIPPGSVLVFRIRLEGVLSAG